MREWKNQGNVLLTGSIKDSFEASGCEFKVRSFSMIVHFSPAKSNFMGAGGEQAQIWS